ncbi:TetR/AcrR family transcriptional regulator [Streptomyces sp. MMCC 100]|uniref:TetR/AcrR family transcriptional regulator n=1 Tax=Streptomyces sp. MMCC 100 TaxID=3163555 RepID=UPI003598418E
MPARTSRRTRTAEETRDVLLDAAAHLFRQHGYESTSLKALGTQVGVSPSAMYWHFSSKSDLLFAVVERTLLRFRDRLVQELAATDGTPRERIRAFVRFYVHTQLNETVDVDAYTSFLATAHIADHLPAEACRQLIGYEREIYALLRTAIEEGIASGEFGVDTPSSAAFAIVGMCENVQTWCRHGDADAVTTSEQYADYALSIVRTSPA